MKPLQTVRYGCYECMIVFDLSVAPPSEWVEQHDDEADIDTEPIGADGVSFLRVCRPKASARPADRDVSYSYWGAMPTPDAQLA